MDAYVTTSQEEIEVKNVESVMAATEPFPYWVFRYPQDKDGNVRVRFLRRDLVAEVELVGKEEEPKLASVTPIRKDENLGTIS